MDPTRENCRNRSIGYSNASVQKERRPIAWIWDGIVAQGAVTLLSAPEKIGKTTLLSLLLDRRRAGGSLLGRTVQAGGTLLCSEESMALWSLRQPPLDFGSELIFHRPYLEYPTHGSWKRFMDEIGALSMREDPFDLLVIDTVARFLPLSDRNKRAMRQSIGRLELLASNAIGVLLVNQSRNMHRPLAAFADMVIEMAIPRGLVGTRRRIFTGVGRYPGTLQAMTAELNAEGIDYMLCPESVVPPTLLETLRQLLGASETALTSREILAIWPSTPPREDSLWRTLTRGCESGVFVRTGAGTKTDAFRYRLASETGQDRTGYEL